MYYFLLFNCEKKKFILAWYDSYSRWYAYNALPNIAQTGANVVRIVWLASLSGGLTINDLDTIMARAIQLKLVPMIELHG